MLLSSIYYSSLEIFSKSFPEKFSVFTIPALREWNFCAILYTYQSVIYTLPKTAPFFQGKPAAARLRPLENKPVYAHTRQGKSSLKPSGMEKPREAEASLPDFVKKAPVLFYSTKPLGGIIL